MSQNKCVIIDKDGVLLKHTDMSVDKAGIIVFDSEWNAEDVMDWLMQDGQYRYGWRIEDYDPQVHDK